MRFECYFENPKTGERRAITVALDDTEIADVLRHRADRGPHGPGAPNGPLVNGYALRRAARELPAVFQYCAMPVAVPVS